MFALAMLVGFALIGLAARLATFPNWTWQKRALGFIATLPPGLGLAGFGVAATMLASGGPPEPDRFVVVHGVSYERTVMRAPQPNVVHVARIDLSTPGLRFVVSPGAPDRARASANRLLPFEASTVLGFASREKVDIAINGGPSEPTDPLTPFAPPIAPGAQLRTAGPAAAYGVMLSAMKDGHFAGSVEHTVFITETNQVTIGTHPPLVYHAISGDCSLVRGGAALADLSRCAGASEAHARTALALDKAKRVMWLVVVDAYRKSASNGMTAAELASTLAKLGADEAIHLGAGSASAMAARGKDNERVLVSTPVTGGIANLEQSSAMQLGIVSDQRLAGNTP
jgi:Phosphodiester glycosidase